MESYLEKTLDTIEYSVSTATAVFSGDWLKDHRLREKIYLDMSEVVNLTNLTVHLNYCMKTLAIVDNTSQDMSLNTFDERIEVIRDYLQKIEHFVGDMREIQSQWYYLLHLIKFAARGEIDREAVRLYNGCTEDLNKIQNFVLAKAGNLCAAFAASEAEMQTDHLKENLNLILVLLKL